MRYSDRNITSAETIKYAHFSLDCTAAVIFSWAYRISYTSVSSSVERNSF
jgi:hypothetical protein